MQIQEDGGVQDRQPPQAPPAREPMQAEPTLRHTVEETASRGDAEALVDTQAEARSHEETTQAAPPAQTADTASTVNSRTEAEAGSGEYAAGASVHQEVPDNQGTVIGVQIVNEIRRLRGTTLPPQWVTDRLAAFVRNDDSHKHLAGLLDEHRVAVLHGDSGTGRYTTALDLLREHMGDAIRQVRREPGERFDPEELPEEAFGWILDLRAADEKPPPDFGQVLAEGRQSLARNHSYLLVLTRTETWLPAAGAAPHLGHRISPPNPTEVLAAHLQHGRPTVDPGRWLAEPRISERIASHSPARVTDWARVIRDAELLSLHHTADAGTDPFPELVDHVIQAAEDWRTVLRQWHREHPDSAHRNYLLAAAALDGAPVDIIREGTVRLTKKLGETAQHPPGQQGMGIIELTYESLADLGDDDIVRFTRPGYAEAVVDYFWVDRPHLIGHFTQWTAEEAASLPAELAQPLAARVTQWAIRYTLSKKNLNLLRTVCTQWASPKALPDNAKDLLIGAALDPGLGRPARDQYLIWARQPDSKEPDRSTTTTHLKTALAGAFAELAAVYPQQMLLRLSELAAATESREVASAVADALATLWDQDTLRERIRGTLTAWRTDANASRRAASIRAFLHLASIAQSGNPVLLAQDAHLEAWNLQGWRSALDEGHSQTLQTAFDLWMDHALQHPESREEVIDTFTQCVLRSVTDTTYLAPRYVLLSHLLTAWEPPLPDRPTTARTRLRDELQTLTLRADPTSPQAGDASRP